MRIKSKGESAFKNKLVRKSFISLQFFNELLIIPNPTNISPSPVRIFPIVLTVSFFENKTIITPIIARDVAYNEKLKDEKATKTPVIVVPMFAPIIIAVAWNKVIIPALTKPITIIVVDELDWIINVTKAPIPTP